MSKEFLNRLARGELTDVNQYKRVKSALEEIKREDQAMLDNDQEWQSWSLSDDSSRPKAIDDGMSADRLM